MQCAGADLEPCRCRVHASDQYILLAWTQVPHRELPSCDKGDFRRQGHKSKRHHGRLKRILREAAGTRPSTRLQKYCLNHREYTTHTLLSTFPAENFPSASKNRETQTHTHPRFIEFSGNFRRGSSRQIVNVPGGLCKAVYVCTFHNCDTTLPQSKKRRNKM